MYQTLPYLYDKKNQLYNRVAVKTERIPEKVGDNGVIVPEHESPLCEVAKVVLCAPDSEIKVGDSVLFQKIDRITNEHLDTISLDGDVLDVIYEHEIWAVNEKPFNRIFVRPASEIEVSETGILIPEKTMGITQKGIVYMAPEKYSLQPGDHVEYRKQENGLYPEVVLDNEVYEVLFEADIFTVNGNVAPYRMIVKVDMAAQHIKRSTAESGIKLSPLFIAMLRNLQYAKLVDIGREAQKLYPDYQQGNTVILHHVIESQPYRLIRREHGSQGQPIFEYRIINCWDDKSAEILGRMTYSAKGNEILNIHPRNGDFYCDWRLHMFESMNPDSLIAGSGHDLAQYNDLDKLKNVLSFFQKNAVENAKMKVNGIRLALQQVDPAINKDRYDQLESELKATQREATRVSQYLQKNHLIVLKTIFPEPGYIVAFLDQLYPINLLGKKFVIAHPEFVIAKSKKYMDIKAHDLEPLNGYVIVLPIEEEQNGDIIRPDSAKEKPQKGTVVAVGPDQKVIMGDTVLFRQNSGIPETIDGKQHLVLRQNDLIAKVATVS